MLSIVWPSRSIWGIDMIIEKIANINFMSWEPAENLLHDLEVTVVTSEISDFEVIGKVILGCYTVENTTPEHILRYFSDFKRVYSPWKASKTFFYNRRMLSDNQLPNNYFGLHQK